MRVGLWLLEVLGKSIWCLKRKSFPDIRIRKFSTSRSRSRNQQESERRHPGQEEVESEVDRLMGFFIVNPRPWLLSPYLVISCVRYLCTSFFLQLRKTQSGKVPAMSDWNSWHFIKTSDLWSLSESSASPQISLCQTSKTFRTCVSGRGLDSVELLVEIHTMWQLKMWKKEAKAGFAVYGTRSWTSSISFWSPASWICFCPFPLLIKSMRFVMSSVNMK